MSRGYDWEASFGGCATGTTDKNDEFRPKNAVFRFKLKEINFEAVQTCIVEEFLFGDFKPHNPAQTKLAWPQYEQRSWRKIKYYYRLNKNAKCCIEALVYNL